MQTQVKEDSLVDELLDLIWTNPLKINPEHLKEGTKCPRCHTGFIISSWHASVCLNCGLSEDYQNRYTLMEESLIRWLIANRPNRFDPPRWLLKSEAHGSVHAHNKKLAEIQSEKLTDDQMVIEYIHDIRHQHPELQKQQVKDVIMLRYDVTDKLATRLVKDNFEK